jgi:predicted methyltransferase
MSQGGGFALDNTSKFLRNPMDSRAESSNKPEVPTDKFALRFVKMLNDNGRHR